MCFKIIKKSGAIVGLQFDIKRLVAAITTVAALLIAIGVIFANIDKIKIYAQELVVRPEAERVFFRLILPYTSSLKNIEYNQSVTIEMIKIISSNPEILNQAIDKVNNTGKFPKGDKNGGTNSSYNSH